jgi:lipopolysaccharide export system permease protein
VWRQILFAVVLVVPLQVIWNASEAAARADAEKWYLAYAQPLAAGAITLALALIAGARRRPLSVFRWGRGPGAAGVQA